MATITEAIRNGDRVTIVNRFGQEAHGARGDARSARLGAQHGRPARHACGRQRKQYREGLAAEGEAMKIPCSKAVLLKRADQYANMSYELEKDWGRLPENIQTLVDGACENLWEAQKLVRTLTKRVKP